MTARGPEDLDVARLNRAGRLADIAATNRRRYKRLREAGLCVRAKSHGPAVPGHTLCEPCRVDVNFDQNERYRSTRVAQRVIECGLCGGDDHNARRCTLPPETRAPGEAKRLRDNREYKTLLRLRGQCVNNPAHPLPKNGSARCDDCNAKRRKGNSQ